MRFAIGIFIHLHFMKKVPHYHEMFRTSKHFNFVIVSKNLVSQIKNTNYCESLTQRTDKPI
jgi:hypothetical protein